MRFSIGLFVVFSGFTVVGCSTPEERAVAALQKELGLDSAPYFPKCLSKEVTPIAVAAGEYSLANTVQNPQGSVAIDRCVRWDTNEPSGKSKDKSEKLILTPPEKTVSPNKEKSESNG